MNVLQIQRYVRRFADTSLPRNVNRRVLIAVICCVLFTAYVFIYALSPTPATPVEVCVADHFFQKSGYPVPMNWNKEAVTFVGNGYIGLNVNHRDLLLQVNSSVGFEKLTGFSPISDVKLPYKIDDTDYLALDTKEGIAKGVHCSLISEKCICVYQNIYVHRTRPNVFIQDVKVSNPSLAAFTLEFNRLISSEWSSQLSVSSSSPIYYRIIRLKNGPVGVAIMCSLLPNVVTVEQKREEGYRFACVIDHEALNADLEVTKNKLISRVVDTFIAISSVHTNKIDNEHKEAWNKLNHAGFRVSLSKAENSLNNDQIEKTRAALLSFARAPLLEKATTHEQIVEYQKLLTKNELCYQGHSTMLTPSRLWQDWKSTEEVVNTVNIWMLTLRHHGCIHVVGAGAHGVAQAFLLSLSAASFTHHHLEFSLDPATDLHRQIIVTGLEYSQSVPVNLTFDMDVDYAPLVRLSASSSAVPLYACSAGCTRDIIQIPENSIQLPLQVTRPPTPILFISSDKSSLRRLRETLHVIEVVDAPRHLPEVIALHKGQDKGLPTVFWVILIVVLITFHLFLFKLIYSEWKNTSNISYSKFPKKVLLRR